MNSGIFRGTYLCDWEVTGVLILRRNIRNKPVALSVTKLFELFHKLSSAIQNNITANLTERLAVIISKVTGRTNAEHSHIKDKLCGKRYSTFDI